MSDQIFEKMPARGQAGIFNEIPKFICAIDMRIFIIRSLENEQIFNFMFEKRNLSD